LALAVAKTESPAVATVEVVENGDNLANNSPKAVVIAPVEVVEPIAVGSSGEGLNSVELAAKLGVSKRTAQNWAKELGKTPPATTPKGKEAIAVPPWEFREGLWYPTTNQEEN
jgi:hypothetical protein